MKGLIAVILLILASTGLVSAAGDPKTRGNVALSMASTVVLESLSTETPPTMAPVCGGTFRGPDLVLTAYHCVDEGLNRMRVRSWFGETLQIKGIEKSAPGWDLAIIRLAQPATQYRVAPITTDIVVGDSVRVIGAPDGNAFWLSQGVITWIFSKDHFSNCSDQNQIGREDHQIVVVDSLVFFGNSGGPIFDLEANLVAIAVRVYVWQGSCRLPGTQAIWGFGVGPETIKQFMDK